MKSEILNTHVHLSSGPVAPLAMPEQDLSAGDSWFSTVLKRVLMKRGYSALAAKPVRSLKKISTVSGR